MRELTMDPAELGAVRPQRAPRVKKREAVAKTSERWRVVRARAFKAVVWGGFALLMSGIVLNAAFNQKGRHPAPIMGLQPPAAAPAPAPVARLAPKVVAPAQPAAPDPAAAAEDDQAAPTGSVHSDGIGSMLGAHVAGAPPTAKPPAAKPPAARGAHPRPVQTHPQHAAAGKPAAPHLDSAERGRLTSLFASVSKPHH